VLTPLFQTNFFPDLMHVYVLLEAVEVMPAFLHALPALTAAFAEIIGEVKKRENTDKNAIDFLSIYKE
jgi:hypothetical protein